MGSHRDGYVHVLIKFKTTMSFDYTLYLPSTTDSDISPYIYTRSVPP